MLFGIMKETTFTQEEALKLLKELPAYIDQVKQTMNIDELEALKNKKPKEILTLILEGLPYENTDEISR
jgi:hypothetical protein